ncbi:DUF6735 family protein [Halohasta litorea]|uniref:DUF6735 family protein n=1 Tax=Halohasta litorea TaxID=869891 RepID=A0ABD6DEJ9_9EURY
MALTPNHVRRDVGGDMLDKGVFTPSTSKQYLKRKLAERVGDRQELLRLNPDQHPVRPD